MTVTTPGVRTPVADALGSLSPAGLPFRLSAWDGSEYGPPDAAITLHLCNERALSYVLTAPGDLGMARAYVAGDLEIQGVHPGDPYELMRAVSGSFDARAPSPAALLRVVNQLGWGHLRPPPPPPQEHLPRWRRTLEGLRHTRSRDAIVIQHHYDVSNRFYRMVLGPSMTYSCAVFPDDGATLEEAQAAKHELVCRKLALEPGMRLLDVGCGWGAMVRHAARCHGVRALGITLSEPQAALARELAVEEGVDHLVDIRVQDYRDLDDAPFDAISSIGMFEHVGRARTAEYFARLRGHLRPGGRLLNHAITRPPSKDTRLPSSSFAGRYVFPDGELLEVGDTVSALQGQGLEARHVESLREHYARTLRRWVANLEDHWDEAVEEVGAGRARVWLLYMAGSALGFEAGRTSVHQVLAVHPGPGGASAMPLRPDWEPAEVAVDLQDGVSRGATRGRVRR
jgi:cyclopropane-fatty-acyl-phospholipid synthase